MNNTNIFIDTQNMEERYGEELYKEYLEKENKIMKKQLADIKFYIEQSDIKNMLWGKELLKIIGGNDDGTRNV